MNITRRIQALGGQSSASIRTYVHIYIQTDRQSSQPTR